MESSYHDQSFPKRSASSSKSYLQQQAVSDKERQGNTLHPSQPATPRMLRSISGTLKSLGNSIKSVEKIEESKNYNTTEQHSRNVSLKEEHSRDVTPSQVPQAPVTPHKRSTSRNNELLPGVAIEKASQPSPSEKKSASSPQKNQQFHRKSIGDWDFVKTIGAGSMGKVKLAQHNSTKEICAVKIIPRAAKLFQRAHPQEAMLKTKEYEKEVARDNRTIREGALGRLLFHPYICRLYEMVPMTNHYYMLFEYVDGGQMLDYIVAHGSLKEKNARKFARGIGSALEYCHKNNVVHRDLKIENIMINEKGDIKIIDFGLSNLYSPKTQLKTYCGSLYFAAPELLSAKPYTGPEVDVWSFGVVLYVLVCGKVPFDDQSVSVLHEKIKRGNVEYPNFLSRECISLLSRMLVVDPLKRATLYEVLNHPWMNKGFDFRVMSYVPKRTPLTLPLDPEIIKTIATLDLGSGGVQTITDDLTNILTSLEYQMSVENWLKLTEQGREYSSASNAHILPDPTGGFHPLLSIYYLVDEMRKRKRAKEEAIKAQMLQKQQQQQAQQQQLQQQQLQQQQLQQQHVTQIARQQVPQLVQTSQPPVSKRQTQPPSTAAKDTSKNSSDTQSDLSSKSQMHTPKEPEYQQQVSQEKHQQPSQPPQSNLQSPLRTPISSPIMQQNAQVPNDKPPILTPVQQISKPADLGPISFPERVHTSTIPSNFDKNSTQIQDVPELITTVPEQHHSGGKEDSELQTLDPGSSKGGINAIFRKISTKKSKHPQLQQPQGLQRNNSLSPSHTMSNTPSPTESGIPRISFGDNDQELDLSLTQGRNDPMVRRGVSMKVTAKERLHPQESQDQKKAAAKKDHNRSTSSSNDKNKNYGYIPVEYLPPLPNITQHNNHLSVGRPMNSTGRKLHPTARAKSVGGHSRKQSNDYRNNTSHPPLPNSMINQNSQELIGDPNNADGFFDDVTLDDIEYQEVPQLTEEQIIDQFNHATPGTMPSIEHCKTLFLKGFFSVQTTSTKPLPVIRYNIINVLSQLGVKFQEVKGGFVCAHAPSLKEQNEILHTDVVDDEEYDDEKDNDITSEERRLYGDAFKSTSSSIEQEHNSGLRSPSDTLEHKTPSRQPSLRLDTSHLSSPSSVSKGHRSTGSNSSTHRRKFSIGNSILNSYKKKNGSGTLLPPNTPAAAKVRRDLFDEYEYDEETVRHFQQQMEDDSVDSLNGLNIGGGSDMLISSRIEQRARHQRSSSVSSHKAKRSPLKFEIHIVKVPLVGLYGVQFKKLLGNTWTYKSLASQMLNELNL